MRVNRSYFNILARTNEPFVAALYKEPQALYQTELHARKSVLLFRCERL